jgi:glycosyltransferase A (GT-A) superfamily protein (DUF2064 family)
LAGLGYGKIVVVGSDCPSLTADDILNAFKLLDRKQLVLGPDHRGGCYLIGVHAACRPDFTLIRWHQNTDFQQLLALFGEQATAQLAEKIDLDTLEDLSLLARSGDIGNELAAAMIAVLGGCYCTPASCSSPSFGHHLTLSWQLPPPALASA